MTMSGIWREVTEDEEAAIWAAMWEDSESPLIADLKSDYYRAGVESRRIGKFGVVRVSRPDYDQMLVTFWVTSKAGDDLTLWQKARSEFEDLEMLLEEDEQMKKNWRRIYLPREAGGVSEY